MILILLVSLLQFYITNLALVTTNLDCKTKKFKVDFVKRKHIEGIY